MPLSRLWLNIQNRFFDYKGNAAFCHSFRVLDLAMICMIFFLKNNFPIAIPTLNLKNETMNQAIQLNSNILNDGELYLKNVSLKKGQEVEIIILFKNNKKINFHKEKSLSKKAALKKKLKEPKYMTGKDILKAAGIWAHRADIENSVKFVQRIRQTENERIFK